MFVVLILIVIGMLVYACIYSSHVEKKQAEEARRHLALSESQKSQFVKEERIFKQYLEGGVSLQPILKTSPKVIFCESSPSSVGNNKLLYKNGVCFLTDKTLCFFRNGISIYEQTPYKGSYIGVQMRHQTQDTYYTATVNKNTTGRAVAGALIAGPAGAIVGAASGLSNGGKKTVTTKTGTNTYYTLDIWPTSSPNQRMCVDKMLIRSDIFEKCRPKTDPRVSKCFTSKNTMDNLFPKYHYIFASEISEEDFNYITKILLN